MPPVQWWGSWNFNSIWGKGGHLIFADEKRGMQKILRLEKGNRQEDILQRYAVCVFRPGGRVAMFAYGGVRAMFWGLKFHLKAIFGGLRFAI